MNKEGRGKENKNNSQEEEIKEKNLRDLASLYKRTGEKGKAVEIYKKLYKDEIGELEDRRKKGKIKEHELERLYILYKRIESNSKLKQCLEDYYKAKINNLKSSIRELEEDLLKNQLKERFYSYEPYEFYDKMEEKERGRVMKAFKNLHKNKIEKLEEELKEELK